MQSYRELIYWNYYCLETREISYLRYWSIIRLTCHERCHHERCTDGCGESSVSDDYTDEKTYSLSYRITYSDGYSNVQTYSL